MDIWYDGSHAISFYEYGNSENPIGNLIGHTWKSWGLIPNSRPFVAPPEQKTSTVELPGADGIIDLSESLKKWPIYNNREGSWTFYVTDYNNYETFVLDNNEQNILDNSEDPIRATIIDNWAGMYTRLLNLLHGKTIIAILDDDPDYYYKGRIKMSQWVSSNDGSLSGLTLDYNFFPYKLKIIRDEFDLCNNNSMTILSGRQPLVLEIKTEATNSNTASKIKLDFLNPEMGIKVKSIEYPSNYNTYYPLENLVFGENFVDFILTNLSGINECKVIATKASDSKHIYIRYRVGEL